MKTDTNHGIPSLIPAETVRTMTFDTSHFKQFTLPMIFQCEPELYDILETLRPYGNAPVPKRTELYADVKSRIDEKIGDNAADPRLRSSEAWDCYTDEILKILNLA